MYGGTPRNMVLTIDQALQKAVEAHKAGKLQDAESLYRAILQSQPNHPDANHNLGVLAVSVNKSEAALPLFKTALEANPNQEQFWLSYIDALIKENQFGNARNVLSQAKKLGLAGDKVVKLEARLTTNLLAQSSEKSAIKISNFMQQRKKVSVKKEKKKNLSLNQTNLNKARSPSQVQLNALLEHYQKGRYDLAENLAKEIIQKYPDHPFGWKVLGALYKQIGKFQDSLIANQKVLEISPNDAEAHSNLGITLQEVGRLEDAETSYKKAISIKPKFAEVHSNLGITLQELGRLEDAETSYKKAIAIKPAYAEAHNNLGITLQELGRLEDAETSYKKAIAIKPAYAEAHYNLGNTLKELGRLKDAETSYKKAIEIKSAYAEAHCNLANTLKELGRLEDAEASYKKAIAIKPAYAEAHSNLGNTLKELGRPEDAETSYKKAIAIKPKYAEAHSNLGNTLKELGRLEDAKVSYREAIAIKPEFAEAHYNLGITLLELGRLEDAETSYKKAIEIKPDYAEAFFNLSSTLLYLDKLNEATQVLLKTIEIDPEGYGLKACVELAILNFLNSNRSSSKLFLLKSKNILKNKKNDFKNEVAYWNYLSKLLVSQQNEIQKEIDKSGTEKIYVIGESHSLASHDIFIKTIQGNYLCQSFWIVGCMQWHLGNTLENKYKHKFKKIIQQIPAYSNILLSMGEIDCRIDAGILNHIKKYPLKDKGKLIKSTVNDYFQYIFLLLTPFSYNITIQGVPCPNINIEDKSKEDFSNLIDLVKEFNVILKKQSHFYGFNFLDLHKLTDRGDGFSNGKWHIDQHHLSPAGMQEAWLTCFIPYSA